MVLKCFLQNGNPALSLSLSGVCLTKRFHQAVLIEAICRGCAADVNLCLGWQVYTHTSPLACLSIENSNVTSQKKVLFFWFDHQKGGSGDLYFFSQVVCGLVVAVVRPNLPPICSSDPLFINWFSLDHAPDARIVIVSWYCRAYWWSSVVWFGMVCCPGPIKGRPAVHCAA